MFALSCKRPIIFQTVISLKILSTKARWEGIFFWLERLYLPEPVECRRSVDVVFVIDSTSNLEYSDFYVYVVGTVLDVIRRLDINTGRTRVAAVQFANDAKVGILKSLLYAVYTFRRLLKTHCFQQTYCSS